MRLKLERGVPAEPTCGTPWCELSGVRPVLEERPTKADLLTHRLIYARLHCPECRKRWGGLVDMLVQGVGQR